MAVCGNSESTSSRAERKPFHLYAFGWGLAGHRSVFSWLILQSPCRLASGSIHRKGLWQGMAWEKRSHWPTRRPFHSGKHRVNYQFFSVCGMLCATEPQPSSSPLIKSGVVNKKASAFRIVTPLIHSCIALFNPRRFSFSANCGFQGYFQGLAGRSGRGRLQKCSASQPQ